MILGQGAKRAIIEVVVGIASTLALTRLVAKLLFGVSTYDPLTFWPCGSVRGDGLGRALHSRAVRFASTR